MVSSMTLYSITQPPTPNRMWWHQAMFLSFFESLNLLVALAHSVPLLAPSRRRRCTEGLWETWLDFRGRDYLGQSHLALVFLHTKSCSFCVLEKKNFRQFSDLCSFLPYFVTWRVYCILIVIARHWYFSMSYFIVHICCIFFTRSRLHQCPLQTPDLLLRCPWEQCPRWAAWMSSEFCTQSQSWPTDLCASVRQQKSHVSGYIYKKCI